MDFPSVILVTWVVLSSLGTGFVAGKNFNVFDFGAKGDGKTDNSIAFSKAWNALCQAREPSTLVIPVGTFLLQPITFNGACNSKPVHVQVFGTIVAPYPIEAWHDCTRCSWITFQSVDGLVLSGNGVLDGQGSAWWGNVKSGCVKPTALGFYNCNNLSIRGIHLINSPRNHMVIYDCVGVTIFDIHITAPENSPNTDGINMAHVSQVSISDSSIASGDDCISVLNNSSHINITKITCGPGHGISIGSLGGRDEGPVRVEEVHVQHCTFKGTMNGARIKTWPGGTGTVRAITFQDITLEGAGKPIIIDQHYNPGSLDGPVDNEESSIAISDVTYIGVTGTSSEEQAITLDCSKTTTCKGIQMDQVNIQHSDRSKKTFSICNNAEGKSGSIVPIVACLKH